MTTAYSAPTLQAHPPPWCRTTIVNKSEAPPLSYEFLVTEVYSSNYLNRVSLGFTGEVWCHAPVEEIQKISDLNMVLLKRMFLLDGWGQEEEEVVEEQCGLQTPLRTRFVCA
jgi:hypothetical protein